MATVTGSMKVTVSVTQATTLPGAQPVSVSDSPSFNCNSSGTAADQVNLVYAASLSLAATPTTLDLNNLTDPLGGAVAFVKVKGIFIYNKDTTDGHIITIGPGASNGWSNFFAGTTPTLTVQPSTSSNQGIFLVTAPNTTGWAVNSVSNKTIKLDPGANTIACDVVIWGTNA